MSFKNIRQTYSYDNLVDFLSQPKNKNYKPCDEELAVQKENFKNTIITFPSLSKSYNNLTELVNVETEFNNSVFNTPIKDNFIEIKPKPKKRREREKKFDELSKSPNVSDILKKYNFLNASIKYEKDKNDDYFLNYD